MGGGVLDDEEEGVAVLVGLVEFDDVRVVQFAHDADFVDETGGVLDSAFGEAFDDSGGVGEEPLPGEVDSAVGTSS